VKDATSSALLSAGITLLDNMARYVRSKRIMGFDLERSRKFAEYMEFWRGNSEDTSIWLNARKVLRGRTYFVFWRAGLITQCIGLD